MPMSQIDLENLRANLVGDAELAKERASSAFATRGAPEESSFAPKAFRIGNRILGEAELEGANDAIEKLIGHYKTEAAFKDDTQAGLFEMDTRKKLHRLKLEVIRRAGEADKRMARAGVEKAQREKVLKGIAGVTSAAAFSVAIGIGSESGGGGPEGVNASRLDDITPGAPTSSQMPQPGSLGSFGL